MTETTPDKPADLVELPDGIEPVTEHAGVDPLDELTVTELDIVSRQLKCDVYEAVGGKDGLRWAALARLAWLWAKRRDPHAKLQTYVDLTGAQLTRVLRLDERRTAGQADTDDATDEPTANPTDGAHGQP
jgi:hypothetical protein